MPAAHARLSRLTQRRRPHQSASSRHSRLLQGLGVALLLALGASAGSSPAVANPHRVDEASTRLLPARTAAAAKRTVTLLASIDRQRPSAPTNISVSSATATAIAISWGASSDDVGVVGYGVYLDGVRVSSTPTRRFTFSLLSCGRTYQLGVDAYDAARKRSTTRTVVAATKACIDASPPTSPSYVRQASSGTSGLLVEWGQATDNVGVAGYAVYRNGVPVGTTQQTSHWLTGLVCGGGYTVAVEAYDAAGNRSTQSSAIVTTDACGDTTPPTVPGHLSISSSTASAISISWQPSSDDKGVAGYSTYIDGRQAADTMATSVTFGSLQCGVAYTFAVVAFDAAANKSSPANIVSATSPCPATTRSADQQPPTTPSGISQTGGSATSIALTWTAASDNVGIAGYGIYRNGTKIADAPTTSFTIGGLVCATPYELAVDAVDLSGNRSTLGAIMAATGECQDSVAPSAPTELRQISRTETTITLGWTASSGGATGYRLFRDGTQVASATSTSYAFTGLACGRAYTLGVEAYDAAGNHSARPATIFSTAACSDTSPPACTGIDSDHPVDCDQCLIELGRGDRQRRGRGVQPLRRPGRSLERRSRRRTASPGSPAGRATRSASRRTTLPAIARRVSRKWHRRARALNLLGRRARERVAFADRQRVLLSLCNPRVVGVGAIAV